MYCYNLLRLAGSVVVSCQEAQDYLSLPISIWHIINPSSAQLEKYGIASLSIGITHKHAPF